MANWNAGISYIQDGKQLSHGMWVMEVSQPLGLTGQTAQSRTRKVFYPRANNVGDITVLGNCGSQTEYSELALFIRRHQRRMINAPHTDLYTREGNGNAGPDRLLRLTIPSEGIDAKGFVKTFSISRKGYFDPAPQFTFDFTVVFDSHHVNYAVSHAIQKFFYGTKNKKPIPFLGDEGGNDENLPPSPEDKRIPRPGKPPLQ